MHTKQYRYEIGAVRVWLSLIVPVTSIIVPDKRSILGLLP